jgi:hypothetical protein
MVGELTDGHSPSNKEVIVDLLDEINIIDTSRRFPLRMPRWATTRARWTWSQKRRGTQYYTQPDYFMARAGDIAQFKGVGLRSPRYLHSDHRAAVANIRVGRTGWLKKYQRACRKFPLSLPPGPKDPNTVLFDGLAAKSVDPKSTRAPGKDWIIKGTWKLIRKCTSLMRSGKIRQDAAWRMQREVKAVLKADKSWLTAEVGERIVSELREGKVQSKRAAPATMPTSVPEGTWGKKRGEAKASSPTHYLLLNSPNLGGDNEGTGVFRFLPSSPLQILLAKPFLGTTFSPRSIRMLEGECPSVSSPTIKV